MLAYVPMCESDSLQTAFVSSAFEMATLLHANDIGQQDKYHHDDVPQEMHSMKRNRPVRHRGMHMRNDDDDDNCAALCRAAEVSAKVQFYCL